MQFQPPSAPGWGQPEPDPLDVRIQQPFLSQPTYQQPQFYQQLTPPPETSIPPMQQPGQYFPQQQTQYPSFPAQQPIFYPPQQPTYPVPGQQLPMTPMSPQKAPKKPVNKKLGIGCGVAAVVLVVFLIAIVAGASNQSSPSPSSNLAAQTTSANDQSTPTVDQSTPTSAPTTPPTPTLSAAQQESAYKAGTTITTVVALDKDGNADSGNDVHFTAIILNFVKDNTGTTAGANVTDPSGSSSVIQVIFSPGTDISQLNTGDTIEVWGNDQGTATGQNAFGATIQEVVIQALYLTDKTTGYQTN